MAGIETEAWRLENFEEILEKRDNEAAWNMERDENLLHAVIANAAPPTVRLYQWRQPAIRDWGGFRMPSAR